jgi:NADPH-dependent curcumin reductase CurA
MNAISHQIQLLHRPTGLPTLEDFALRDVPLPALQEGEVQVANQWLSVDPYMRGRMSEAKSYVPPFPLNGPLDGGAIGTVQASRHPDFKVGDKVSSMLGWRDAFVANAAQLTRLPDTTLPPQRFLGALGMPGMTAWAGLHKVAHLKAGETLLVSAASGAVGTMAVQLAKQAGARVIGSTGSADKVAYLKTLGADAVIIARPFVTAVYGGAQEGVEAYVNKIGSELKDTMAMCGVASLKEITRDCVRV